MASSVLRQAPASEAVGRVVTVARRRRAHPGDLERGLSTRRTPRPEPPVRASAAWCGGIARRRPARRHRGDGRRRCRGTRPPAAVSRQLDPHEPVGAAQPYERRLRIADHEVVAAVPVGVGCPQQRCVHAGDERRAPAPAAAHRPRTTAPRTTGLATERHALESTTCVTRAAPAASAALREYEVVTTRGRGRCRRCRPRRPFRSACGRRIDPSWSSGPRTSPGRRPSRRPR
jgi:hypothetical protein